MTVTVTVLPVIIGGLNELNEIRRTQDFRIKPTLGGYFFDVNKNYSSEPKLTIFHYAFKTSENKNSNLNKGTNRKMKKLFESRQNVFQSIVSGF